MHGRKKQTRLETHVSNLEAQLLERKRIAYLLQIQTSLGIPDRLKSALPIWT
jgi:hypothetical protein